MYATRITAVLLASAGWAPGAFAEPRIATYQVRFGNNASAITLAPGQSTTVTVRVSFDPGIGAGATAGPLTGSVLGLSDGSFTLSAAAPPGVAGSWTDRMLDSPYNWFLWSSTGTVNGLSVENVIWGYGFLISTVHASPANPDTVWTGKLTISPTSAYGTIDLTAASLMSASVFCLSPAVGIPFVTAYDDAPGAGTITVKCYPDCTLDGTLTIADFSCFQTKWVQSDPYADCDGTTTFTIADFACYQNEFVGGCP